MLRDAQVSYLSWVRAAKERTPRISLLDSGWSTPLPELGVDPGALLRAIPPETFNPAIQAAVAARYGVSPEEVLPALGTSLALFLAAAALLGPGDRVLVEHPAYPALGAVVEALGARVTPFVRFPAGAGSGLEDAPARDPEARLILLSDLQNPTGARAEPEALAALAAAMATRGGWVLIDEVYRDFQPGPVGTARILGPNILTVSSLTKVYGLSRVRAGWVLAPPAEVQRMRSIMDVLHALDPSPLEPLFLAGLDQAERIRTRSLAHAAAAWAHLGAWNARHPDLRFREAGAGLVAWADLPAGWTGTQLADRLLERHRVAITPGRFFGEDRGFRIGLGGPTVELEAGLEALEVELGAGGP